MQNSQEQLSRTPLYHEHLLLGAKMVAFAGWEMPIQYKGLREEHNWVRQQIGLFDVSHMGEIRFRGEKALPTLQWLTTNDVAKLESGQAHYNLLPNSQGGLVDDIFVYCIEKNQDYLVCVNAANKDKDFAWMIKNNRGADVTDESSRWAQIAVQGPKANPLLTLVTGLDVTSTPRNRILPFRYDGAAAFLATTGYTGEAGAEIFIESSAAVTLWKALLQKSEGLAQPIGLGARDTLRTEMKYSLYGHEIDENINPFEAGLGWVIKPAAKDFLGKEQILSAQKQGLRRKLVGFQTLDKGIPRQGYNLCSENGQVLGVVTSGTHSPSLDQPIGIGFVDTAHSAVGTNIWVDIRGRKVAAKVVKTPFVQGSI